MLAGLIVSDRAALGVDNLDVGVPPADLPVGGYTDLVRTAQRSPIINIMSLYVSIPGDHFSCGYDPRFSREATAEGDSARPTASSRRSALTNDTPSAAAAAAQLAS